MVGCTYGYGNYDIAGRAAVEKNKIYKTEALAFHTEGNLDNDFLQVSTYIHTYWGDGGLARCTTNGIIYSHGYNPGKIIINLCWQKI